jgi:hypothetical protein
MPFRDKEAQRDAEEAAFNGPVEFEDEDMSLYRGA